MIDCTGRRLLCVAVRHELGSGGVGTPAERIDAPSVNAAIQLLRRHPPFDIILIDAAQTCKDDMDAVSMIRAHARQTPVVLLPGSSGPNAADSVSAKDPASRSPADATLTGLYSHSTCGGDVDGGQFEHRVLVVDDDPSAVRLLERALSKAGYDVLTAGDGDEGLRKLLNEGAHIVVSDWMMPRMDGPTFCRAIRSNEVVGFVYFMILTAHSERGRLFEAFEAGADDYLTKPCDRGELLLRMRAGSRIVELEANIAKRNREVVRASADMAILNDKLQRLAVTDELTGLTNRRSAMQKLHELWDIAQRYRLAFSIISLDIDHFKLTNDTHGHDAGDAVLKAVSRELGGAVRSTDAVARVGGEEFLVITPNTDVQHATILAERIRERVGNLSINHGGKTLGVTVSLGLAQQTDDVNDPEQLLKLADIALYKAKESGRNRWVVADRALIESAGVLAATG